MGVYDTYGKIQIKVGEVTLANYKIGDEVPIPDGVYVGHEGVIVIVEGKFVAEFSSIISKWGDVLKPKEIIEKCDPFNPISVNFGKRRKRENEKKET